MTFVMFIHLLVLFSFGWINVAHGHHNVTVDDKDSTILYTGVWDESPPDNSYNVGGSHKLSTDRTASARLNFTGVAIYLLSPLWPYPGVSSEILLDGKTVTEIAVVDLSRPTDPNQGSETVTSQVVWGLNGLDNESHSLEIRMTTETTYLTIDAVMYTVLDSEDVSTASAGSSAATPSETSTSSSDSSSRTASTSAGTSTSTSTANNTSHSNTLAIALGVSLGASILVLVLAVLWWICRRKKNSELDSVNSWTVDDTITTASPHHRQFPIGRNWSSSRPGHAIRSPGLHLSSLPETRTGFIPPGHSQRNSFSTAPITPFMIGYVAPLSTSEHPHNSGTSESRLDPQNSDNQTEKPGPTRFLHLVSEPPIDLPPPPPAYSRE